MWVHIWAIVTLAVVSCLVTLSSLWATHPYGGKARSLSGKHHLMYVLWETACWCLLHTVMNNVSLRLAQHQGFFVSLCGFVLYTPFQRVPSKKPPTGKYLYFSLWWLVKMHPSSIIPPPSPCNTIKYITCGTLVYVFSLSLSWMCYSIFTRTVNGRSLEYNHCQTSSTLPGWKAVEAHLQTALNNASEWHYY